MYDKLDKIMEKKGKKLSPLEQKAKADILGDMKGQAEEMMGEGLKKVSVLAKDKEGLKEGLEKAGEMVEQADSESEEEAKPFAGEENPSEEAMEHDVMNPDMSKEEIEAKIEMLQKLLEMKQ